VELIEFESCNIATQHQFNTYYRALLFYRATIEKYVVAARVAA
jgi:hypothetical protein